MVLVQFTGLDFTLNRVLKTALNDKNCDNEYNNNVKLLINMYDYTRIAKMNMTK